VLEHLQMRPPAGDAAACVRELAAAIDWAAAESDHACGLELVLSDVEEQLA
jgi:hypothetical protein